MFKIMIIIFRANLLESAINIKFCDCQPTPKMHLLFTSIEIEITIYSKTPR